MTSTSGVSTGVHASERNQEATIWVGGIEPAVTEDLLYELFINCGPIASVHIPRDKITATSSPFAFVEFCAPSDAEYALRVMQNVRLFGKSLRLNRAAKDKQGDEEYHARLFIGNLDAEVDEKMLYDTFAQFGPVLSAKVMTEEGSDQSRGFGFIVFDSFRSADDATQAMNGQYLCNKTLHVSYAFKQGSKGERHGSEAERELERRSRERRGLKDVRPMTKPLVPQQQAGMAGMMPGMMMMPPPPPIPSSFPMLFGYPPPPPIPQGFYPPPGYAMPGMPPPPPFPYAMPPPPIPSAAPTSAPVYLSFDSMPPPPPFMMPPPPPPAPTQSVS